MLVDNVCCVFCNLLVEAIITYMCTKLTDCDSCSDSCSDGDDQDCESSDDSNDQHERVHENVSYKCYYNLRAHS